ncbi:MAG TPA: hypothetical protein VI911_11225 [Patescibacteria group bacterium]|nr:hypothetical protein [Patescibacteria group bacterium]
MITNEAIIFELLFLAENNALEEFEENYDPEFCVEGLWVGLISNGFDWQKTSQGWHYWEHLDRLFSAQNIFPKWDTDSYCMYCGKIHE